MDSKKGTTTFYTSLILGMLKAKRRMYDASARWGLTPAQGLVLVILTSEEPRTMQELSDLLCCDASNITGLTERLEAKGYIERITDATDKRVRRVSLTEAGSECREAILRELQSTETIDLSGLTGEEKLALNKLMTKLS